MQLIAFVQYIVALHTQHVNSKYNVLHTSPSYIRTYHALQYKIYVLVLHNQTIIYHVIALPCIKATPALVPASLSVNSQRAKEGSLEPPIHTLPATPVVARLDRKVQSVNTGTALSSTSHHQM